MSEQETLTVAAGATEETAVIDVQGDQTLVGRVKGDVNSDDLDIVPVVQFTSSQESGPLSNPRTHNQDDPPAGIENWDISDGEDRYVQFGLVNGFVRAGFRVVNNGAEETTVEVEFKGV